MCPQRPLRRPIVRRVHRWRSSPTGTGARRRLRAGPPPGWPPPPKEMLPSCRRSPSGGSSWRNPAVESVGPNARPGRPLTESSDRSLPRRCRQTATTAPGHHLWWAGPSLHVASRGRGRSSCSRGSSVGDARIEDVRVGCLARRRQRWWRRMPERAPWPAGIAEQTRRLRQTTTG